MLPSDGQEPFRAITLDRTRLYATIERGSNEESYTISTRRDFTGIDLDQCLENRTLVSFWAEDFVKRMAS